MHLLLPSQTSAPGQPPREATFTPPYLMTVCLLKAVLLLVCAFEGPTGVGAMWNLPVGLVACGAVSSSLGLLTLLWVTDVTPRHYAEVTHTFTLNFGLEAYI